MIPNMSEEVVLQLKNLKPGNCIAFGQAFKVPTVMYLEMPNPTPLSNNVDLKNVWYQETVQHVSVQQLTPTNEIDSIMQQQATQSFIGQPTLTTVNESVNNTSM